MPDILEIREFFVEGGSEKKSHVLLHIGEPSTPEEKKKGYFFALTEINRGALDQIKEIQRMIDDIETRYFEQMASNEDAFEATISHANRRGHHILGFPQASVHCIVGILRGNALSFASHGDPEAALLYRRGDELEYTAAENADEMPDRLFSNVMTANLGSGDFFYIATPRVREFFGSDRVRKILAGRTVPESVEHIEKVLIALRDGGSYGGIVFHILPHDAAPKTGPQPKYVIAENLPEESAKEKTQPKEETNYRPRPRRGATPETLPGIIMIGMGRALVAIAVGLARAAKRLAFTLGRCAITLIILATNKGGQRHMVLGELKRAGAQKKEWFRQLPLMSKLLLGITIVSAFVFAGSMGFFQYAESQKAARTAYEHTLSAIRDKKDAAEASMIYGDDTKAFTLLKEAEALVVALPQQKKEEKNMVAGFRENIGVMLKKIQKWETIDSDAVARIEGAATGLVALDDKIIAYGPEEKRLFLINAETKTIDAKSHETIPALFAASAPKEQDTILFASGPASIAAYQKHAGEIVGRDISFPNPETAIQDIFVYNQRLFVLDPKNNQVYKHAKTQTGYDRGAPWIKTEGVDISDAVGLAIDGDIFILAKNSIRLFASGIEQALPLSELDPPLKDPARIWTYNGVTYLYVLEPTHQRLIVLEKNGKLVKQYTDPKWKHPTGMVVDEEKKTAYILDSNIVYRLTLE